MPYKFAIIAGTGVVAAAAFGYFFSNFALTNGYGFLIIAIICGIMYIALFSLRMLITERTRIAALCIALDMICFAIFFFNNASLWLVASAALAALWLLSAWRAGRNAINNMVRVKIYNLGTIFIKPSLRAILFLSIASYLSLVNPAHIAVSREMIGSLTQTINSDYGNALMQQITDQPLTPETSNTIINKTVDTIQTILNKIINLVPPNLKTALLIGIGIIIFLLLGSTVSLVAPLVNGLVWLFLILLLRADFIKIKIEAVNKETIVAA